MTSRQRSAIIRRQCDEWPRVDMRSVIFLLISVLGARCTDAIARTVGKRYTYRDAEHLSPEQCKTLRFAATVVQSLAGTYAPTRVRRWFNARAPQLQMRSPRNILEREGSAAIELVWHLMLAVLGVDGLEDAHRLH